MNTLSMVPFTHQYYCWQKGCNVAITSTAILVPWTKKNLHPRSTVKLWLQLRQVQWRCFHFSQQLAERQPQQGKVVTSTLAEDWFYLKNLLSSSRMHSLNIIFQWIVLNMSLTPRIQDQSLWPFVYSENNASQGSVQSWAHLKVLQHKVCVKPL